MAQFDKFTERARKVLQLAQEEAIRLNHNYVGTEHLLLGLVREGDGVAARVLFGMGVQLPKVRSAVESIVGRGESAVFADLLLTPRAKKVLEFAVDEGRRLNHHYVGTEHLLLGILRLDEGIAITVLNSLRVGPAEIQDLVMGTIKSSMSNANKTINLQVPDDRCLTPEIPNRGRRTLSKTQPNPWQNRLTDSLREPGEFFSYPMKRRSA